MMCSFVIFDHIVLICNSTTTHPLAFDIYPLPWTEGSSVSNDPVFKLPKETSLISSDVKLKTS